MAQGKVEIRPALPADLVHVQALLGACQLPLEGVEEHFMNFLVAFERADLLGCAGLEVYGDLALLRSLAVAKNRRDQGLGTQLVERVMRDAGARKLRDVFLLTTSARDYFLRLGFRVLAREEAPAALFASSELTGACPASAVLMTRPVASSVRCPAR